MRYNSSMDYYAILGVAKTATAEEIKTAYRKLAMKHHPDRGGDHEQFQKMTEAYNTLRDPASRAQYDQPQQAGPGFGHAPFGDMFSQFFRQHAQQNAHSVADITISFEQAYTGADLNVNLGYATEAIKIPAGVRDGTKIRLPGKGASVNGTAVDLIIRVNIAYPPTIGRELDDLFARVGINAIDAMIGCNVDFDHVSGKTVRIKVPAGTQHGTRLKLADWGMNNPSTTKPGDLYVIVSIETPAITDPQHVEWLTNINTKEKAQ